MYFFAPFVIGSWHLSSDRRTIIKEDIRLSYVLPVIVAALHAPKDSIVIIENPESHIHPDGQSKLMELKPPRTASFMYSSTSARI